MNQQDVLQRLYSILMPYAFARRKEIIETKGRFVHYTSADCALKIVKSAEMWMRDTRCMNDYSEVQHGWERLRDHFHSGENRRVFYETIDACHAGIAKEAVDLFDQWFPRLQSSTYLACMSEHHPSEDHYGRLSLWRAYGAGTPGVALVLRLPLEAENEALKVFLSPVAYIGSVQADVDLILSNVRDNLDFLKSIPRQNLIAGIYMTLVMAAVSIKHPGFIEEKEWRAIYFPEVFPSDALRRTVETINGVPQTIYRIPLRDDPAKNIQGIAIPQLVDRVIIGPSDFPGPIASAFIDALTQAGVQDAQKKVSISDIPLRV